MQIQQKLLTINKYSRPGTKRNMTTKIAVHYVGNAGSSAIANRNYFESLKDKKAYASAHYIVGLGGEIIQCIPDHEIAYTTNCANSFSIGIEVCHPGADGVFTSVTRKALIELVTSLLKKYKLSENDIIRHFDVTGKACPLAWASNSGDKYADYLTFKNEVKAAMQEPDTKVDTELFNAASDIIKEGIGIDFNLWKRLDLIELANVPILVCKLVGIEINGPVSAEQYKEAIDKLVLKECISQRLIWDEGRYTENNVRSLLIKYAKSLG